MQAPTSDEDELLIGLMEQALARPREERDTYLRERCENNATLLAQARHYLEWEERMQGFLLQPLIAPRERRSSLAPGQLLIGRFRLLRQVGHGGMGTVWEAEDEKLNRRVALKFAKAGFGNRISPEVRHAREISHRNVCKIHELHTAVTPDGELDFISMEFVDGETLVDVIRKGALQKKDRLGIALQLCAALEEAHRNGIVHGDLKSNNVILSKGPDGGVRAVVMDFGLATRPDPAAVLSGRSAPAGTPAYMAPELWKGVEPSVASDIYALGVVLWEVISGKRPDSLGLTSATLSWEDRPAWKPPKGHGKWDSVLARCLQQDPARRFRGAKQVAAALGPPVARKWLLAGASAAVLAITSGLVTYERTAAPVESVRLALLPFQFDSRNSQSKAEQLSRDVTRELTQLKGTRHTAVSVIPATSSLEERVDTPERARAVLGASHALRTTVEPNGTHYKVRAQLVNAESNVSVANWSADYNEAELRYLPAALAGVATETLHLPPIEKRKIKPAALGDYNAGLQAVRKDSGLDEALHRFERAVAEDPESASTYAGLAEARWFEYSVGNAAAKKIWLERTEEAVREAQKRNPDLPEVHRIAGLVESARGSYEGAIREYLRAIELDPGNGDAYRRLGSAYESNNQPEQALAALRKAAEKDPLQYRNHLGLGMFFYERADFPEAINHYRRASELAPGEARCGFALGVALMSAGQFGPAEQEIRKSINLSDTAVSRHQLGVVLIYEGKDAGAVSEIQRAIQYEPEVNLWWMNLGTAYRRLGKVQQSRQAYGRALALSEKMLSNDPRNGLERARVAYICAQLGEGERAESEMEQSLKQAPNSAAVSHLGAFTFEALGLRERALAVLETSSLSVRTNVALWPDMAELRKDPRFLELMRSHSDKK